MTMSDRGLHMAQGPEKLERETFKQLMGLLSELNPRDLMQVICGAVKILSRKMGSDADKVAMIRPKNTDLCVTYALGHCAHKLEVATRELSEQILRDEGGEERHRTL